jgi:hypothetical protein
MCRRRLRSWWRAERPLPVTLVARTRRCQVDLDQAGGTRVPGYLGCRRRRDHGAPGVVVGPGGLLEQLTVPLGARSIPRPPFPRMSLPYTAAWVPESVAEVPMSTPGPPLASMMLPAPEPVPPIVSPTALSPTNTPAPWFPSAAGPLRGSADRVPLGRVADPGRRVPCPWEGPRSAAYTSDGMGRGGWREWLVPFGSPR